MLTTLIGRSIHDKFKVIIRATIMHVYDEYGNVRKLSNFAVHKLPISYRITIFFIVVRNSRDLDTYLIDNDKLLYA